MQNESEIKGERGPTCRFWVALRACDSPHAVGQLGHVGWDPPPPPEAPGAAAAAMNGSRRETAVAVGQRLLSSSALPDHSPTAWRGLGSLVCPAGGGPCEHQADCEHARGAALQWHTWWLAIAGRAWPPPPRRVGPAPAGAAVPGCRTRRPGRRGEGLCAFTFS